MVPCMPQAMPMVGGERLRCSALAFSVVHTKDGVIKVERSIVCQRPSLQTAREGLSLEEVCHAPVSR